MTYIIPICAHGNWTKDIKDKKKKNECNNNSIKKKKLLKYFNDAIVFLLLKMNFQYEKDEE